MLVSVYGAHDGPPIEIWMKGAGLRIRRADDETDFDDDYLLDSYTDALTTDLQELTRQRGY